MRERNVRWGEWLANRMAQLGYATNSDLARESGVPDSVISRWRHTGSTPALEQLRRLRLPLQASLLELMVASGHLSVEEAEQAVASRPERRPRNLPEAIELDEGLPADLKHLLRSQYEAMRAVAAARALDQAPAGRGTTRSSAPG